MSTRTRIAIALLALSPAGFALILQTEGFRPKAYIPVPGDVPTIGYGTTNGVKLGDTITMDKAIERARLDMNRFEGAVKRCIHVPLTQSEYDIYIHFAENVGSTNFCTSTMAKKLNKYDYIGACNQFDRWMFVNNKDCRIAANKCGGIPIRRAKEKALCLQN